MNYAEATAPTIPMKPTPSPAFGLSVTRSNDGVLITRRWLRPKHFVLALILLGAGIWLASAWAKSESPSGWLVVGSLFWTSYTYNLAAMFINRTTVSASPNQVRVTHGPLPSLFARASEVDKNQLERFFVAGHGFLFAVHAKEKNKDPRSLVAPLVSREQADQVVAEMERALGFASVPEEGGGSRDMSSEKEVQASSRGLSWLGLLIPIFVAGVLLLFFAMAKSEVKGSLQAKGDLGTWSFAPNDCSSGQLAGYRGVSLESPSPSIQVRLVDDPIKGQLIVVAEQGKKNHVLDGTGCSQFLVNVHRTSTSINDVWVMEGHLSVACPELSGQVSFDGCH